MTTTVQTAHTGLAATPAILGSPCPGWGVAGEADPWGDSGRQGDADRLLARRLRAVAGIDAASRGSGGDLAAALWSRALRFDAADPGWPDRDRFVLSPGHGADVLRGLRQLTGCPQEAAATAIESQGLAAAVGMALAERFLAARFGRTLVDHRTWLLASDGDLMQGVSHEAASLAGQLRLERLAVLWEAEGEAEDTLRRFAAYGWATRTLPAGNHAAIAAAVGAAMRTRRPMLLACLPTESASAAVSFPQPDYPQPDYPQPDYPPLDFLPPDLLSPQADAAILERWRAAGARGAAARRSWLKRLAHHPRRIEFERAQAGLLPETLGPALQAVKASLGGCGPMAPEEASVRVLTALRTALPDMVGAAAEPAGSKLRTQAGSFASRFLHFGSREHGMAAAMNGMAAHGGVLPYAGGLSTISEAMRPALRLAARMGQRVVHVLTHPSEAEAARRPIEQLAGLRAVPNLHVLRPADAVETVECWELALRREDGPSLLLLDSRPAPPLRARVEGQCGEGNRCADGGYVVAEAAGPRRATLIATGAEVALALAARARLIAEGIAVAVVSLPCWDLFANAGTAHRTRVLGEAMRFGIEAGSGFGWERWLGPDGVFIGCEDFAASCELTPDAIAATVRRCLAG